jgi:hypothetical protein
VTKRERRAAALRNESRASAKRKTPARPKITREITRKLEKAAIYKGIVQDNPYTTKKILARHIDRLRKPERLRLLKNLTIDTWYEMAGDDDIDIEYDDDNPFWYH